MVANPRSLVAKVLTEKYQSKGGTWESNNFSFGNGVLIVKDILRAGLSFKIENAEDYSFWEQMDIGRKIERYSTGNVQGDKETGFGENQLGQGKF